MSEDEKQFVQTLITENAGLQEAYADMSHALDQKDSDLIKARELIVSLQEQNAALQTQINKVAPMSRTKKRQRCVMVRFQELRKLL